MVAALKVKDELRLTVLRGLLSLFTHELTVTQRTPSDALSDEEVVALIRRSVKQREDAAAQYRQGGREELATREDAEREVLRAYLPQQMSVDEVREVVLRVMAEQGVSDKSGVGKLMGAVMRELKGRADGTMVKDVVENCLALQ